MCVGHELTEILLKNPLTSHLLYIMKQLAEVGTALFGKQTKQRQVWERNLFDLGLHKSIR